MNELHLFAGAGGGILGGQLLGHRTVCAIEIDSYARSVLVARQNDGSLPPFPIWDDVCTFDGTPWRGAVDVVCGGFPCQDISAAGKGVGIDGARSGLWREFARIIGEVQPRYVFVENSPLLVGRGLARVLGDLAEMGFDARWGVIGAHDVGAPHKRDRLWIVGHAIGNGRQSGWDDNREHERRIAGTNGQHAAQVADAESQRCGEARELRCDEPAQRIACGCENVSNTTREQFKSESHAQRRQAGAELSNVADAHSIDRWAGTGRQDGSQACDDSWWATEPNVDRVAHGVAFRVDRLKAIGNGQVPQCAAAAWLILMDILHE